MQECKGSPTAIKFYFEPVNERNREVGNVVAVLVGIAMGYTLLEHLTKCQSLNEEHKQELRKVIDLINPYYATNIRDSEAQIWVIRYKGIKACIAQNVGIFEFLRSLMLEKATNVDEQHKEAEQLRDLTSARNVETLKLRIMKLRRRRSLKENSLLLKRARIQPSKEQSLVGNESLDVSFYGSLSDMDDSTATFAEVDSLDLLGAIVLDNVSGTFDNWNKFYANSTSGPG
ncbi:hypothetical protein WN944_022813 [Citrus x changshan-huyou]|uniref:Uncharacterized protein n=1 Tax=Citrus x changshan-huyou TaxID=2935761 RepID=A0AAP0MZ52_9ROSI